MNNQTFIIARTDSIGDVMLTLPMCGILKKKFPGCTIYFLGRAYTQPVIEACEHVDHFLNWDKIREGSPASQIEAFRQCNADTILHVFPRKEICWIAKRAGIPVRIATARRLFTIGKCNKLVFFSRKGSDLHEAQLNLKLMKPLGIQTEYSLEELAAYYGFNRISADALSKVDDFLKEKKGRKKILLHPLSKGSAVDWGLENFSRLIALLEDQDCDVFITGTKEEGEKIRQQISLKARNLQDVTGMFSLAELIALISRCDALVAASTGPLHIAAALEKRAVGLYSPKRPIHPGRWAALGKGVKILVASQHPRRPATLAIAPEQVFAALFQDPA